MSEQPKTVDVDPDDDDEFAEHLALGFGIAMPVCALVGLLLFDQFGLGIAAGVILGPLVALILRRLGQTEA